MGIVVVTDSTADLSKEIIEQYNIVVVPLNVFFGDKMYKDGVDMDSDLFFHKLINEDNYPKTSQPSPVDFEKIYSEIIKRGDNVISIHISSKMSGTYQSASIGRGMLAQSSEQVSIIDSQTVSVELGAIVVQAAKLVKKGLSREEIIRKIELYKTMTTMYFMVDTLKYLQKGGRIGKASAFVGGILNVKPILIVSNGEVSLLGKARGVKKAVMQLRDYILVDIENMDYDIYCAYAENTNILNDFQERLGSDIDSANLYLSSCGAIVGAHVGPGSIAVAIAPKEF